MGKLYRALTEENCSAGAKDLCERVSGEREDVRRE